MSEDPRLGRLLFDRGEFGRAWKDLGGDCGEVETVLLEKNDCSAGRTFVVASSRGIDSALTGSSLVEGIGLLIGLGVSVTGAEDLVSRVGSAVRLDWKLESEEGGA